MMVGTLGQPPRGGDVGPGRLVALGLVVSMVSFAGFRVTTDTKPSQQIASKAAEAPTEVVSASIPNPIPSVLFPRLTPADPNLELSSTSPVASPEPKVPATHVSSLVVPAPVEGASSLDEIPEFREIEHRFLPGETFAQVLGENGVTAGKAADWIKAASRIYALSQIREGQNLQMKVDVAASDLISLKMDIDVASYLVARRKDGTVVASREAVEFGRVRRVVEGTIDSSFYASAARADIPDETIAEVAEVLGWDLDFEKVKPGAKFHIQFEELRNPDGGGTLPGQLLAVRIKEVSGKIHEGIWFQQPGEKSGSYYTSKGVALGRDYLRYPVSFTRISSGFSYARLHPVLNRTRPHYGVDFAAPTGTPVRAVADGIVEMAAWHGGNGRYVQIRHDDVYESGYGHLSRFSSGMRPGAQVKKGDIIGYVGQTGLASGPHLHFVMYKNDVYIDPLSASAPRSRQLSSTSMRKFGDMVRKLDAAYAAAERAGGNLVLAATGPNPTTNIID
jgi:murein DD-endopeptidase MepM/ murein hydrolase activator NlpD